MTDIREIKKARIIVVDDEPLNLILLEEVLLDEDFCNVEYFDAPLDALAYFKENPVDLILLDLKMPKMDGYEFMEALKTIDKPQPSILVLTASADNDTHDKVLMADAQGIISKPFDIAEVVTRIEELVLAHFTKAKA